MTSARACTVLRQASAGAGLAPALTLLLTREERLLRRRRLVTRSGETLLVDLPETTELRHGDRLVLDDGRAVEVIAAAEPLLEVTAKGAHDLARLAWHVGNRHAPCRIEPHRLLIPADDVMAAMLRGLGATVRPVSEPFEPEGGAYGHGRTMGHAPAGHAHD